MKKSIFSFAEPKKLVILQPSNNIFSMKKILSFLLIYIIATAVSHAFVQSVPTNLFGSQTPGVEEVDSGKCGRNVIWKYHTRTKVLEICGKGSMWNYGDWFDAANHVSGEIPWKGKAIKTLIVHEGILSITQSGFKASAELTSVIIPGSVKKIGKNAFESCPKLTYVVMSEGVREIGESAFADCQSICTITIPNSVKKMGDYAFFNCITLRSVTLSKSLKSISQFSFSQCENLDAVEIPEGVKIIKPMAFYKCSNLTTITLPKSLKSIGEGAIGCTRILYGALEHPVALKNKKAFEDNPWMNYLMELWR